MTGIAVLGAVAAAALPAPFLTFVAPPKIVAGRASAVCHVANAAIRSCAVVATTRVAGRERVVARGRATPAPKSRGSAMTVALVPTGAGRGPLRAAPGGLPVALRVTARTRAGERLTFSDHSRLLAQRQTIVPPRAVGPLFVRSSVRLTPAGRRYLRALARKLRPVDGLDCAGHVAAGEQDGDGRLGIRRGTVACRTLSDAGLWPRGFAAFGGGTRADPVRGRSVTITVHR